MLRSDKKGGIIFPTVIFIVFNVMFFSMLLYFVFHASTGAFVYEQAYAKEIALVLDKAKPGMQIKIDFEKGFEIAEKNKYKKDLVKIKDNSVIVSLNRNGGYSFDFFSDYDVDILRDGNFIILEVKENV